MNLPTSPTSISPEVRGVVIMEINAHEGEIDRGSGLGHFVQQLLDAQKAELSAGFYGKLAAKKCIRVRELENQLSELRVIAAYFARELNEHKNTPYCKQGWMGRTDEQMEKYQQWLTLNPETKV